jgi:hypothetical protein
MARPSKQVLAVLGASGALAIGIAVPVTASAADNKSASSLTQNGDKTPRAGDRAARLQQLKSRLDQAVTDGKLTRAEADAIVRAAEAGVLLGGGNHDRNQAPGTSK